MAMSPVDPKNADKRTAERYIRTGLLDEKDYRKQQEELPDVAEKATPVETKMYSVDEEEDFEDEESDEESGADEAESTDET